MDAHRYSRFIIYGLQINYFGEQVNNFTNSVFKYNEIRIKPFPIGSDRALSDPVRSDSNLIAIPETLSQVQWNWCDGRNFIVKPLTPFHS